MIEACSACGVPIIVGTSLRWGNNGVISLSASRRGRMVFYESDLIDMLFRGIEGILGISISHIVVESRRRDVRRFMELSYPEQIKQLQEMMAQHQDLRLRGMRKQLNIQINEIGLSYGFGKINLSPRWETGEDYPWHHQTVANPFSIHLYAGGLLGSVEAFDQQDLRVDYREVEPDIYELSVYPGEHPIALKDRLKRRSYPWKPGEIDYETCPVCGVPVEVAACRWNPEEGTIMDPETGRRMAIFDPLEVDRVLHDLEQELGESLPGTVIEVVRLGLKAALSGQNWRRDAPVFNHIITLRGLGNLVRFDGERDSLSMTIENACLPLLMVGTAQGLFELVTGKESSSCQWNMSDDGDLTITVGGPNR